MPETENPLTTEMAEYRALLVKLQQKSQVDYDKAVLTLSGGALAVTFAFFKDISERLNTNHAGPLLSAWLCWGFSVACVLASHYTSQYAIRAAISQIDQRKSPQSFGGWCAWLTSFFNAAGGILFVIGVFFAACFIRSNL